MTIFENGEQIGVGNHGDHDYVYSDGVPVPDTGKSTFVFEDGVGVGGGIVIDDFEDADLSEYTGDTGSYSIATSPVFNGTYSLKVPGGSGGLNIVSQSGLDTYPEPGDTFRFNHYQADTAHTGVLFGVQNSGDYYTFDIDTRPGTVVDGLQLSVFSNGSLQYRIDLADNLNIPLNEWLEGEVSWSQNGDITCTVWDSGGSLIGSISGNDTTYGAGGFGVRTAGASSAGSYIDYARKV